MCTVVKVLEEVMKLSKILATTTLLLIAASVIPAIASTSGPIAHPRLDFQYQDTTRNIEHFGYTYNSTLFKGANIDKLTITPEVVVTVMDPRFNPDTVSKAKDPTSAQNTKKLIQAIVTKALAKFNGDATNSNLPIMIAALQEKGPVVVEVTALGFNKKSAPTDAMSDNGATALFDALKDTQAVTDANSRISARTQARSAAIQSAREAGVAFATESNKRLAEASIDFSHKMIGLYEDGVLSDHTVDTSAAAETVYPKIIESLKRLGAQHSALTGELARLRKERQSPYRSTPTTPVRQETASEPNTPARRISPIPFPPLTPSAVSTTNNDN